MARPAPAILVAIFCLCGTVAAQPGPDGFDWVTVGAVNNPAYNGYDPEHLVTGRGSVDYEYRIARTEITTAQFVEFYNAFSARPDPAPPSIIGSPVWWGASIDPDYHGPGTRYIAPGNRGMFPVTGIDWRVAARFCNWLCNNKSTDHSALTHGAYDTSTFGYDANLRFTDQVSHTPGAPYFLPSLEEWLKAVHYDPNRYGPGQGGWWTYPISRDTPPTYGPPPGFPNGSPSNEANAGFSIGQGGHWAIPLGSYPNAASPWGLLDAAGATSEWTEGIYEASGRNYRITDGSWAGDADGLGKDLIYVYGATVPNDSASVYGFRIASAIPSPHSLVVMVIFPAIVGRRARPGATDCSSSPTK